MGLTERSNAERQAKQDTAVGIDRRPFESDGAYFARAMWHYKAEAEVLEALLRRVHRIIGSDDLAAEVEAALGRPKELSAS